MKTTLKKTVARIFVMAMVLCTLISLAVPASATATTFNQKIIDAKKGVVQIDLWYVDQDTAEEMWLGSGTGFLINEDTVITCNHVVRGFSDEWYVAKAKSTRWKAGKERTAKDLKENLELRISVLRDVHVRATVKQYSEEMDFAILTLNDKLHNRETLVLRSSKDLAQTEAVYALGFPAAMDGLADQNYYDADDVTITTGNVNKTSRDSFVTTSQIDNKVYVTGVYSNVDCVAHSAVITSGNSGGPLVDANGNVVGINAASNEAGTTNLAISIDQLMATMDALGIEYTKAEDAPAATEAPVVETEPAPVVTEAPVVVETQPVVTEAPVVVETQPAPTEPVKEDGGSNMTTILIVAAIAVVAVVVVIVVVMSKGKKKAAPAPVYNPPANNGGFTSQTNGYTAAMGAGETTVLSGSAGETTVLSRGAAGGTLIRKRNGESIVINAERFVIGRERKTSNYCIADNSSISRSHVTLSVRGGITYLTDMNAANGTFVNGVKAMPNQEIALKNGDKITLADEDFEFRG